MTPHAACSHDDDDSALTTTLPVPSLRAPRCRSKRPSCCSAPGPLHEATHGHRGRCTPGHVLLECAARHCARLHTVYLWRRAVLCPLSSVRARPVILLLTLIPKTFFAKRVKTWTTLMKKRSRSVNLSLACRCSSGSWDRRTGRARPLPPRSICSISAHSRVL